MSAAFLQPVKELHCTINGFVSTTPKILHHLDPPIMSNFFQVQSFVKLCPKFSNG